MKNIYKTNSLKSALMLVLSLIFFTGGVHGSDVFSLGPLLTIEKDDETNSTNIDALGPFITIKNREDSSEFGIRPLIYNVDDDVNDNDQFDLLYPLITYDRQGKDVWFQTLVYLIYYRSLVSEDNKTDKKFFIFPFIFSRKARNLEDSYFALFPIYGSLKNVFKKDEINFYLFPLFLQTKKEGLMNSSFLWPFFGAYHGNGQEGFRFWPLFGYRKIPDQLDEQFALWPIYISRRYNFYGEERRSFSILPFYYGTRWPERKQDTYLWPFINHTVNEEKGFDRWDLPWPIVNFQKGENSYNRVFPFYSKRQLEGYQEGFYMWPVYRYKEGEFSNYNRRRIAVLFYLYNDVKEEPLNENGKSRRRINVWPLFSYERDNEGNKKFHLLSLYEPFDPYNKNVERSYSSFWRIYQWEKDHLGNVKSNFLWNTFRTEHKKDFYRISLQPIIPIFSFEKNEDKFKFNLIGGVFGYSNDGYVKKIKLLFIPIPIARVESAEKVVEIDDE